MADIFDLATRKKQPSKIINNIEPTSQKKKKSTAIVELTREEEIAWHEQRINNGQLLFPTEIERYRNLVMDALRAQTRSGKREENRKKYGLE